MSSLHTRTSFVYDRYDPLLIRSGDLIGIFKSGCTVDRRVTQAHLNKMLLVVLFVLMTLARMILMLVPVVVVIAAVVSFPGISFGKMKAP